MSDETKTEEKLAKLEDLDRLNYKVERDAVINCNLQIKNVELQLTNSQLALESLKKTQEVLLNKFKEVHEKFVEKYSLTEKDQFNLDSGDIKRG
jgi:hypothetical protein